MKVFGIAGKKGSGKTSLRNFFYMNTLKQVGIECWLNQRGDICMPGEEDMVGVIEMDGDFGACEFAEQQVYPRFRAYSLADSLKMVLNLFYNIPLEKMYGTNDDKNEPTIYTVGDVYGKAPKGRSVNDRLTIRELMEQVAFKMEKIDSAAFHNPVRRLIEQNESEVVCVADVRDMDDVNFVHSFDGLVIKLNAAPYEDSPGDSPLDLVPESSFDTIIYNENLEMSVAHDMAMEFLQSKGFF